MKNKLIISIFFIFLLLATPVFATNAAEGPNEVFSDLEISEEEYILDSKVSRQCLYYV